MKRNDIKALKNKSVDELLKQLNELTMAFAKIKLEKKVGRVANPRSVSMMADDIARIKTVLTEKELKG
jgi:ribosomal protein L29